MTVALYLIRHIFLSVFEDTIDDSVSSSTTAGMETEEESKSSTGIWTWKLAVILSCAGFVALSIVLYCCFIAPRRRNAQAVEIKGEGTSTEDEAQYDEEIELSHSQSTPSPSPLRKRNVKFFGNDVGDVKEVGNEMKSDDNCENVPFMSPVAAYNSVLPETSEAP